MTRPLASLALGLLLAAAPAHAQSPEPRLVRVALDRVVTLAGLLEAGLDVVDVKAGESATLLEWPGDAATLATLGARVEVLDDDPAASAARRAAEELAARPRPPGTPVRSATGPDGVFRTQLLPPFGSGSMGGYWTLDEVKMKLDQLVADDTHDVVADKLDTLGYTVQGRPIWGLELGKSVVGPDTRPVAFFNALTHAREPEGMQTVFYFVDDLLAGYASDPFATYLLDQRVIYIVPVVNPDGYERNRATNPGGGGNWRKNLRDNDGSGTVNSQDGVDLNRNFGYQWGYDNIGSSGTRSDATYRGPSAFSEPETQAQRDIVVLLGPRTGLSFHTYSDLLLNPWGYTPAGVPDSAAFYEWNDEMSLGNGYMTGSGPRILYAVNGEFNDWCYGDEALKPRAFTWTPEVGNDADGFWPAPSRIVPLARQNLRACYTVAAIAGAYVRVESAALAEGTLDAGGASHLAVRARNIGLDPAGPELGAALASLDAGANVLSGPIAYPTIGSLQSADATGGATFTVAADDTVTPGRLVRFRVEFTTPAGFYARDTVEIPVGTPTVVFADGASGGLGAWDVSSAWGIVSNDPIHPSRYFADSPSGKYAANSNARLTVHDPLDLSAGVHAYAFFDTRWQIENDYDAAVIEASLDGSTWTPLAGRATVPGAIGVQPAGKPVYAGVRNYWKPERVDLSAFAGPTATAARLRYRLVSDSGAQYDGFNFDSLRVVIYDPLAQPQPVAVEDGPPPATLAFSPPAPNPARDRAALGFALPRAGEVRLEILDVQGRRVRRLVAAPMAAGRYVQGWDLRDEAGRHVAPGLYLASLSAADGRLTRRLVVIE